MRFELIGSGMAPDKIDGARAVLAKAGARNVREAYANGWRNQPRTLRFTADSDADGERIGEAVNVWNNPTGTLGGGGGMIRAYGLHWKWFGRLA
jgi:hypothetical protein